MKKIRDHSKPKPGEKFNRLTVREVYLHKTETYSKTYALCDCDCGGEARVSISSLRRGKIKSCGCLQRETASAKFKKHGDSQSPLYRKWASIKTRCYNPSTKDYPNYGARGIKVCDEWLDSFPAFRDWCLENGWKRGLQLDRKDNDGDYSPDNCHFVTVTQNQRNKRTSRYLDHKGKRLTVAGWAEELGIAHSVLYARLHRGWSIQETLDTPLLRDTSKNESYKDAVFEAFGEAKTMREWLSHPRCRVGYDIIRGRLRKGWGFEEAMTTPLLRRKR